MSLNVEPSYETNYADICESHIRGCCAHLGAEEHRLLHYQLPYLWQLDMTDGTGLGVVPVPVTYGFELESAYCNPLSDQLILNIPDASAPGSGTRSGTRIIVDFDNMTAVYVKYNSLGEQMSSGTAKVRRLSTPSYISSVLLKTKQLYVTQWRWYWFDEKSWKLLGEIPPIPQQSVLESKFLSGRQPLYLFEVESEGEFVMKLQASRPLSMKRLRDGCKWRVRRRPLLVTSHQVSQRLCQMFPLIKDVMFADSIPSNWTPVDTQQEAELVPVNPESMEYHLVFSEFERTLSRAERRICDIFRVQNPYLWHKYSCKKMYMEQKGKPLNETQVFHGTRDDAIVRAIVRQNFDWRLSGTANAALYGQGVYFALSASFSDKYAYQSTRPRNWMFLARVIVGSTAVGKESMTRPPPINLANPHEGLYDSCTNSINHPKLYVIFDGDQCYPEYLISYTGVSAADT